MRVLSRDRLENLHQLLGRTVERAVEGKVPDFADDWLIDHRQQGETCPRCGGRIDRLVISGRGCYLCREHQRPPPGL